MTQRVAIALGGLSAAAVLAFGLVAVGFGPAGPPGVPAAPEAAPDFATIGVDSTTANITDEAALSLADSGLELIYADFDVPVSQAEAYDDDDYEYDDDDDERSGEHDDDEDDGDDERSGEHDDD